MADTTVDPKIVAEEAKKIADQQVEELKQKMVQGLTGANDPNLPPQTWGVFRAEQEQKIAQVKDEAIKTAEKLVEEKLAAREKYFKEQEAAKTVAQQQDLQKEYAQIVSEYREAVSDGHLPPISADVDKKLSGGAKWSDLSETERQDPGLRAYNEVFQLHKQLKAEGKSSSFYRTAEKFWRKQPAGAQAPVFGSGIPTATPDENDYSYDDVVANRKRIFKR